ncbi:MAG: hypothetical protein KBA26_11020 [Candidatus Delongbacteria bacterium]|nr:hypothetical protein [Candidatus Delongbacteria bacterium]
MNKCPYTPELDRLLFDRDSLSPARIDALTAHLEHCTECRKAYQELSDIHRLAINTPLVFPEPSFFKKLPYQIAYHREKPYHHPMRPKLLRPLITFSTMAIVFWGAYFAWWSDRPHDNLDQLYWETFSLEKSMQLSYTIDQQPDFTSSEIQSISPEDEIDAEDLELLEKNIDQYRIITPRQE